MSFHLHTKATHITNKEDNRDSQHKIYTCEDCEFETIQKKDLPKHKQNEHKRIQFSYESFDFRTTSNEESHYHNQTVQVRNNVKCRYVFIHKEDLSRHNRTMHEETGFKH